MARELAIPGDTFGENWEKVNRMTLELYAGVGYFDRTGTLIHPKTTGDTLLLGDGTVSQPGLAFEGDADTGFRLAAVDDLRVIIGGVDKIAILPDAIFHGPADVSNTYATVFMELAASGTNYVGFKAPDAIAENVVWTLPDADGGAGDALETDGAGHLSWETHAAHLFELTDNVINPITDANVLLVGSGAVGEPSYSFLDSPSTGFMFDAIGGPHGGPSMYMVHAGKYHFRWSASDFALIPNMDVSEGGPEVKALLYYELESNGYNHVGFKAPDAIASNVTWILPDSDGAANSVMYTDGSGTLSWQMIDESKWNDNSGYLTPKTGADTIIIGDGTTGQPGVAFAGDSNTGIYLSAASTVSVSCNDEEHYSMSITALSLHPYTTVPATKLLSFMELDANGSNSVSFRAPDLIAANVVWTLPDEDAPASGMHLTSDASANLFWGISSGKYGVSFVDGDLTAGVLTITHDLDVQYPVVSVFDNSGKQVTPDEVTSTGVNTCTVDLSSYGTLTGTYNAVVVGGSTEVTVATEGSYTANFTDGDLTAGVLAVNHALAQKIVCVSIYDNNDQLVSPDGVALVDTNNCNIDLSSYGTLTGTWSLIAAK